MQPFAYGLREHSIFEKPFAIDRNLLRSRGTPAAFQPELTNSSVQMLPLVEGNQSWPAGWCTYPDGFENNPDIEIFCGGLNEKTPRAAACWRQGNLFHFGFEQKPSEMNETGQHLFLNSIAYISRFTEDRPIAVTPSVFGGPVCLPRTYLDRRLQNKAAMAEIAWMVTPELLKLLQSKKPAELTEWHAENRSYLHPGPESKLEIDEEARALRAPLDRPEFFSKNIALWRSGSDQGERAQRLLARYAPAETAQLAPSADAWEQWFQANKAYLFFSDQGDYRWYVDPLARKRQVPSSDLRGPARASVDGGQ